MIEYVKLNSDNKEKLINLIDEVLDNLERKEFFIPFTQEEINEMFNPNKVIIYGAFDNDKLVGTLQVYLDESYVADIKKIINLDSDKVVELGGALVLENYRNKGVIKQLAHLLIEEARNNNFEYMIMTVHPDNIASNKATKSLGPKLVTTEQIGDYLRNIYLLDLKK